jgi:hypothetical protein
MAVHQEGWTMIRNLFLQFVSVGLMLVSVSCTYVPGVRDPSQADTNTAATPVPVEKMLSTFNRIEGTHYLMARISANPEVRDSGGNPLRWLESGYSSYSYDTYNFVFFDLNTETYHRLLPTNQYVILQLTGFPTPVYDPSQPDAPSPPFEWWLYTIVKADTDGNGLMNYEDKLTLGISDVGGNGFAEMIGNVDSLLGHIYDDNSSLFVIYHSNGRNYITKINLPTREVVTTTEMDLGEDVK